VIPGAHDLFVLDPSVTHLNHGSFGSVPTVVRDARQRLLDEFDANPLRLVTGDLWERTAQARTELAQFIGAEPDLSAFVINASHAAAIVLKTLDLGPGDQILLTDHSYNAFTLAAQDLATRRGVRVVIAPVDLGLSTKDATDAVIAHVNERTKLVIVDQISSATAQLHPVAEIAAALRERGVPLMVDGAHAPGMIPLPLAGIDADFWVGNFNKWAFGPVGTALLRVSAQWADRMLPLVVSHGHLNGFQARVEQQGTRDFTAWLSAPAGLTLFATYGEAAIQRHNVELAAHGQRVLGAAFGLDPAELPHPGEGVSMRIVPLPDGLVTDGPTASKLRRRIADELRFEVAINPWRGRGWLRLSAEIYNSADDYDRLAAALPAWLKTAA
jgi:isopenicillin-N epimerase